MAVLGWPKTLSWKDFGSPVSTPPASYAGSHTDCHIDVDIGFSHGGTTLDASTGDYKLKDVKVTVSVNKLATWVATGVPTSKTQAAILKHEQGHYNIAGIAARDAEHALKALRAADAGTLLTDAQTAFDGLVADGQTEEDTYDDDAVNGGTDHGNDTAQQAKWNSLIVVAKSLADLP